MPPEGAVPLLLHALQHALSLREQRDQLTSHTSYIAGKEAHELHRNDYALDGVPILVGPHSAGALKRLDNLEKLLKAEAEDADAQSAASASKSNAAAKLVSGGHAGMHPSPASASAAPASVHLKDLATSVTLLNDGQCLAFLMSRQRTPPFDQSACIKRQPAEHRRRLSTR